ncbi:MAG: bifunctional riboflavin kinase/FAD synthetase [Gallionella sp.]|jgi:riboflavin kinase/FMN adenylyltransferase|nr:bifunctional riboflavin kinase/FAD synthetase [Gallionella sp.]
MQILRGLYSPNTQPVAITVGNFDGVHLGHQSLLADLKEAARARGLQTAVVIFEPHPREFLMPEQAPARLTSLREKLQFFAALDIDRVHVCRFNARFAQMSAADFINALHEGLLAQFVLIGDDFRFGKGRLGDFALLEKIAAVRGFEVQAVRSVMHDGVRISSTAIRAALFSGQLRTAQRYLGRHYSMSGRVVRGDQVGRKLGFPTANIQVRHPRLPLAGIYVAQVHGEGLGVLQGAASMGVRPTVKRAARPTLEVHLFEFDQQIYGKHLRVEFLQKLRDEEKYPDLATLARHIALDVENAKKWFEQHD